MNKPQQAPYGAWVSPITSDFIVSQTIRLGGIQLDGKDIYWLEGRPTEGGRSVIVRQTPDGGITDVLPQPFNARTRVHEYGGASYLVYEGIVYFSNFSDQRLYRVEPGDAPTPLTAGGQLRYADAIVDDARHRLLCVYEAHTAQGKEPVNGLAAIDLTCGSLRVLARDHDFYAAPRLNPAGDRLAWLTWDHPRMPWDGTELWVADILPDGSLDAPQRVAGGPTESICQPEWSPTGELYFASDRSGWWNLYRQRDEQIVPMLEREAEFGAPQWSLGTRRYLFAGATEIICVYTEGGMDHLARLDTETGALTPIPTPYVSITPYALHEGQLFFHGAGHKAPSLLAQLDLETGAVTVLRRSARLVLDPAYFSEPEAIEFPTTGGATAYGFFYPPQNPDFVAPEGTLPPLLVISHGGPTAAAESALSLRTQYWTSRGFAVLDVNYGGSTGYGRAYRERLKGQWGIVDVDDCINGARYLVAQGRVDGDRLAIRGGSAGGYTTLAALTQHDFFHVGASYYGVGDLEALARFTHKFESRYLDGLIGPYPARRDLYVARSPKNAVARLSCSVIFFQGSEDPVVPPDQSRAMFKALREKGLPVAYLEFEGEAHGFRRAENIKRSLEAELYFYGKIFGFEPADEIEPVKIENL